METRGSSIHSSGLEMRSTAATKATQPPDEKKQPHAAADSSAGGDKGAKMSRTEKINDSYRAKVPKHQTIVKIW